MSQAHGTFRSLFDRFLIIVLFAGTIWVEASSYGLSSMIQGRPKVKATVKQPLCTVDPKVE